MLRLMNGQIAPLATNNQPPNVVASPFLDRKCLLVTEGTFDSMDGKVTITPEHLEKLRDVYAKRLEIALEEKGQLSMADYAPAQVDHSTSSHDTIGRLIGPLYTEIYNDKLTLFGTVRFLGTEAVECVSDGRWANLSIGIKSLETCVIDEITITPFPACPSAVVLSRLGKGETMTVKAKHLAECQELMRGHMEAMSALLAKHLEEKTQATPEQQEEIAKKHEAEKAELAAKHLKEMEDKQSAFLETMEPKKEEEGDKSGEEPEKKLSEPEPGETQAHEDSESKTQEDKEHKDATMSATDSEDKAKFSAMLSGMRTKQSAMRLAIKQANVKARLTNLRACAKITPAELKKIDVVKLSAKNDETIDAVLESYANRQPVIHTAIYGTVNAVNPTTVMNAVKKTRMSELEKETRARMTSVPQKEGEKPAETSTTSQGTEVINSAAEEVDPMHTELWSEMCRAIRENKEEEAKELFKKMSGKRFAEEQAEASETDMAKLMAEFAAMDTEISEVIRLGAVISGIKI